MIYATPASKLARAVRLSRLRRAGYAYVTNLRGSPNPYATLPSYWKREVAAITAGRPTATPAPVASEPRPCAQPAISAGGQRTVERLTAGINT